MNSTRGFSNLHRCASALNGNNGEFTNSDDVALTGFICRRERDVNCARHYHRMPKKASTGAARRIQEKVKLCKPIVDASELELCTVGLDCVLMSDTPHYHIHTTTGGRASKGLGDAVALSIEDGEERAAGIADALQAIEEEREEESKVIAPTLPTVVIRGITEPITAEEKSEDSKEPATPPGLKKVSRRERKRRKKVQDADESNVSVGMEGNLKEGEVENTVVEPVVDLAIEKEVVSPGDDKTNSLSEVEEKDQRVADSTLPEVDEGPVERVVTNEAEVSDLLNNVPAVAECKDAHHREIDEALSLEPLIRERTSSDSIVSDAKEYESSSDESSVGSVSTDHWERVIQHRREAVDCAGDGTEMGRRTPSSESSEDSSEYSAWRDFDSGGEEISTTEPPPPPPEPDPDPWMEDVVEVTIYSMFDAEDSRHPLVRFFREVYDALLGAERNVVSPSTFRRTLTHGTAYAPSIFNLYYGRVEQETFQGVFDPSNGYQSEYKAQIKQSYSEYLMRTSTSSGLTVGGLTAEWLPRQLLTTLQREFPDCLSGNERIQITVDTINYVMVTTVLISAGLCNSNGFSVVNKSKLVSGLQKLENRQ